jgi:two-component system alkaline phosphatase synthesis response regulator PhoP
VSEKATRVLVVEDDLSILTGVSMNLKFEGYDVLQAQDGRQGLQRALDERPDLLILDLMLPEMNGYEVLRELRQRGSDLPVLLLSAKGLETDKVLGFQLGADDYVVKPFGLKELLARVKALLKRRFPSAASNRVSFSDTVMDLEARTVTRAGQPVELTAQEIRLLEYFVTPRTVDNFVRQLRLKLEPEPDLPRHFVTARGLGYRFEK